MEIVTTPLMPTQYGNLNICAFTHIGSRPNQEDRFICAPNISSEFAFFGVFDGTVKEHASEWVHKNFLPYFLKTKSYLEFMSLTPEQRCSVASRALLEECTRETYAAVDAALLQIFADLQIHYSACTSVTVLIHLPTMVMYVAHLGDSHAVLGSLPPSQGSDGKPVANSAQLVNQLIGSRLTYEHKPDQPGELKRIEAAGGSLIYLKTDRPFIRGGDFKMRQHAMQLNYSRAFGGKDLKMYGLSAVPDVTVVELQVEGMAQRSNCNSNASAPADLASVISASGNAHASAGEPGPSDSVSLLTASAPVGPITADTFPTPPGSQNSASAAASIDAPQPARVPPQLPPGCVSKVIMLGSDGVWDVLQATTAVNVAMHSQAQYQAYLEEVKAGISRPRPYTPAERVVQLALQIHEKKGSNDNVTCICIFLP